MKKTLKKYFIPHEGNDHKPHALRSETVFSVAIGLLVVEFLFLLQAFVVIPATSYFANILPGALVVNTNNARVEGNLPSLTVNPLLEDAARLKVEDMIKNDYFAHTSPDGVTPWYWIQKVGYTFHYAGENLAVNFSDSVDVSNAWMNSPLHRENVLNGKFTEIGIAAAKGTYKGQTDVVFVVQLFGAPATYTASVFPTTLVEEAQNTLEMPLVSETRTTVEREETFVAVRGVEVAASNEQNVAAIVTTSEERSPITAASLVANPKGTVNFLFVLVTGLVLIALALKIFIAIRIQHPRLIIGGLALLILIGGLLVTNDYLTLANTHIL